MQRFVWSVLVVSVALTFGPVAQVPAQSSEPGIDFVPDVEDQFGKLALRPEALGFDIGASPDPAQAKHYQGIVRLPGPGIPYLFVARSGNCPGFFSGCQLEDDDPGNLLIVKMSSRDTSGERLRSNRFARGLDIDDTRPDASDTTVAFISFDGTGGWPAWGHPGGMQIVGDILALPLETHYPSGCDPNCETEGEAGENLVLFLDISDPENPTVASELELQSTEDWSAGLVGLTPVLNDEGGCCNYLMLVTGAQGKELRFFESVPTDPVAGTTDLADPALSWELRATRTESQIELCLGGADWHTGVGDSHQTLNFVREGSLTGALYLIGARNTTLLPGGEDWLDLYLFDEDALDDPSACLFTLRDSTHFTSKPIMGGGDSANFAAAGGVYVSPSGELLFYATEYENDGPNATVRFGEYRHREVVRSGSPTLRPTIVPGGPFTVDEGGSTSLTAHGEGPLTKAWLMLFEDDGVGLSLPGLADKDDWLMADYVDWGADDFDDFREEDYSDDAGSWRWFAPSGCTLRANDDDFGDDDFPGSDTRTLHGTGDVEEAHDLNAVTNDDGESDMDDAITSMQFFSDCTAYYGAVMDVRWDLDGDGGFELFGSPATFSAAGLDGPSDAMVVVRAEHPTDPTDLAIGAAAEVTVQVLNVAPTADAGADLSVPEGTPVARTFSFSDPGAPDTHSATVDWGDEVGQVAAAVTEEPDATTGTVSAGHTYGDDGVYVVELCVADDDGGEGCDQATAAVSNVDPALTLDTAGQVVFPGGGAAFLGRVEVAQAWSAGGSDPGSDDLELTWSLVDTHFGGTVVFTDSAYHCNDPSGLVCPDPFPSSQTHHFPMVVSAGTDATPAVPGVFELTVGLADDDGGSASEAAWLVVTDDRGCTLARSGWRRELGGPGRSTIPAELVDRYLHVAEFASASFSENECGALHDLACLRAYAQDLLTANGASVGDEDVAGMRGRALAELVAAWLNFASGAVGWDEELDPGGELFHDAVARWEALVLDPAVELVDLVQALLEIRALNRSKPCTGGPFGGGPPSS